MKIKQLLVLVMIISVLIPITGCTFTREKIADFKFPSGTDLSYEKIWASNGLLKDTNPQVVVIDDNHTPIPWINTPLKEPVLKDLESIIQSIDYSKYFLIIIYSGFGSVTGSGLELRNIWQTQSTVYIKVHFFVPEGPYYLMVNVSPYYIFKISKDKMTQFDDVTFKLFDEFANQKAETVQFISSSTK
jgi:hypothetical protein